MGMDIRRAWLQRKGGLGGDDSRVVIVSKDFVKCHSKGNQQQSRFMCTLADQAIKVCRVR